MCKDAFAIHDNYIIVKIPFNANVLNSMNVSVNVGVNVGVNLNEIEKTIIELVFVEPTINTENISHKIRKAKRTAERYLKALQEKGYLTRSGSDKNGIWKVVKWPEVWFD